MSDFGSSIESPRDLHDEPHAAEQASLLPGQVVSVDDAAQTMGSRPLQVRGRGQAGQPQPQPQQQPLLQLPATAATTAAAAAAEQSRVSGRASHIWSVGEESVSANDENELATIRVRTMYG